MKEIIVKSAIFSRNRNGCSWELNITARYLTPLGINTVEIEVELTITNTLE